MSRSSSIYYYEPENIVIDRMTVSYKEAGTKQSAVFKVLQADFGGNLAGLPPGLHLVEAEPPDMC